MNSPVVKTKQRYKDCRAMISDYSKTEWATCRLFIDGTAEVVVTDHAGRFPYPVTKHKFHFDGTPEQFKAAIRAKGWRSLPNAQ